MRHESRASMTAPTVVSSIHCHYGEHQMEKKPYAPPAITEHGSAVTETKGFGGKNWEPMSPKLTSELDPD